MNKFHPFSTNPKRSFSGQLPNSNIYLKKKPFDQQVLSKREIATIKRLKLKMEKALLKFHKDKKCVFENKFNWPCDQHFHLETGKVHHYPNGYYIE